MRTSLVIGNNLAISSFNSCFSLMYFVKTCAPYHVIIELNSNGGFGNNFNELKGAAFLFPKGLISSDCFSGESEYSFLDLLFI
jgi:hypothetical protein